MRKPVNTIEIDEAADRVTFNLSSRASNDDWLRAARLLQKGHTRKFEELDNKQGFTDTDEEIEEQENEQ